MNSEQLTFRFSEAVDSSSFDVSKIRLQSKIDGSSGATYTLTTSSSVITPSGINVIVQLGATDVFNIKKTDGLCRTFASTFLVFGPDLVTDLNSNPVVPIADGKARVVNIFIKDFSNPYLTYAKLNVDTNRLYLTFSELVMHLSVMASGLIVQRDAQPVVGFGYNLGGDSKSVTPTIFATTIELLLSAADMNALKSKFPLISSRAYSYISLRDSFVTDVLTFYS